MEPTEEIQKALDDAALLRTFVVADRSEVVIAAITARHGPMVLGVCRRILKNSADVDDAFQATFLLLSMTAKAVRDPDLLGRLLYWVATSRYCSIEAKSGTNFAK